MTTGAYLIVLVLTFAVGFSVGINLRGNPPKRTRKTRKLTTPVEGQSVIDALGPQRAQTFQLMSPEEVETSYRFTPKGIFESGPARRAN